MLHTLTKALRAMTSNPRRQAAVILSLALVMFALPLLGATKLTRATDAVNRLVGREWITAVHFIQNTTASAPIGTFVADKPYKIRRLVINCNDNRGSGGNTTVKLVKNGSDVSNGSLSIAYNAADRTQKMLALDVTLAAGDVVTASTSATTTTLPCIGLSGRMEFAEIF